MIILQRKPPTNLDYWWFSASNLSIFYLLIYCNIKSKLGISNEGLGCITLLYILRLASNLKKIKIHNLLRRVLIGYNTAKSPTMLTVRNTTKISIASTTTG